MTQISEISSWLQKIPMTDLVDLGVNMARLVDQDLVAAFLLRRGVRFSVVVRILAEPSRRRTMERSYDVLFAVSGVK
jgi:hypothetical protein